MTADRDGHEHRKSFDRWHDERAREFAGTEVVEIDFIGMPPPVQARLNHFKLWALKERRFVDLDGKRVLEFGAGHGRLALAFPAMKSYLGVDYSKKLVEVGNRRLHQAGISGHAELVHGDVTAFEIADRSFDVVCSLGMMCYFPDPVPVLATMARLLEPGGMLFFDFRVASPIYNPIRRIKWMLRPPTGGVSFSLRTGTIDRILAERHFTDIRFQLREFPLLAGLYASSGWGWPLALRNALADRRLMRPLATEAWVFARKSGSRPRGA